MERKILHKKQQQPTQPPQQQQQQQQQSSAAGLGHFETPQHLRASTSGDESGTPFYHTPLSGRKQQHQQQQQQQQGKSPQVDGAAAALGLPAGSLPGGAAAALRAGPRNANLLGSVNSSCSSTSTQTTSTSMVFVGWRAADRESLAAKRN
eukprot:TRINITY_DN1935_c0_g2_i2.p2 TRINITY_DN1935_c0_g2~~TRINITY_DN1935_c0_g2_i2.p2  ORF type:complete len:150 (+),score=65.76 TRINITY_DN1935_c0_g2_i2:176-625(+)